MTNLVAITVKATDSSDYAAIRASAAKAGADAADEFNRAFKLRADASGSASERIKETGGAGGRDDALMARLRQYASTPGGIGILGTGSDTSLLSALKSKIMSGGSDMGLLSGTNAPGTSTTDMVREVLTNSVTGSTSSTDFIKQVLEGAAPSNVSTSDVIKQVLTGSAPGNVTTEDIIKQVVEGAGPKDTTTTDLIKAVVDDSTIGDQGKKDGKTYGDGFAASLKNSLSGLFGGKGGGGIGSVLTGSGGSGGGGGGVAGALDSGGVAGGALPGVAGVSGMAATVTGLAAALVAVLPAITSVLGGLTAIGGGFAILETTDKKFAADMKSTLGGIESVFESAAAPLAAPLESAAKQIGSYFQQIGPLLKQVFGDSASLIQPLVYGFEGLVGNLLPGFTAMIKAAGPVFQSVAGSFAGLGKSLGEMFQDFASDGKGSATILSGFLGIINSLLPFIGELGKVLVSALAPAFTAFSSALSAVLPALTPLMSILGSFAGAVLTDLGSVLGAVGQLLVGLAPSFTSLATVASNLFNTLENAGVFAVLGDVLENLAKPLAGLINALVTGLAPALPPIISAVGQVATLLAGQLGAALGDILTALTPVIAFVAKLVAGLVTWLSQNHLLIPVLILIAGAIDPVGTSIALVGLAISELVTHWSTIWGEIKSIAADVGTYLDDLFHNKIVQDILAVWSAGLIPLAEHWTTVWGAIENTAKSIWGDIKSIFDDFAAAVLSLARTAVQGFGLIVNSFLSLVGDIIDGAVKMFGWIPGVGGLLKGAASHFDDFRTSVKNDFGDASTAIQGLINKLEGIPAHVSTSINVSGTGSGGVVITASGLSASGAGNVKFTDMAEGGLLGLLSGGIPGMDSIPIMAMPGEAVVPAWLVPSLAPYLKKMGLPGFASGGLVGLDSGLGGIDSAAGGGADGFAKTMASYAVNEMLAYVRAQLAAAAAAAASAGPGGGDPATNAALAKKLFPKWASGINWTDWNNVAMRESGWNQFATNPSSGAYGIPQALPFTKMPKAAWPASAGGSSNPTAQIDWMAGYMSSVYGGPQGAWAHEQAYGWYDEGGWLPPGRSIAINNTGAPERVIGPGGLNVQLEVATGGQGAFEAFMSTWIKNYVRIKGGGNVQAAFGRT